jgi:hypothetical protein
MRRLYLFLFPTLIVFVSVGLISTVRRSKYLQSQFTRAVREALPSACPDTAELAEVKP